MPEIKMEDLIRKIDRTFPMPQTLMKLLDILNNPDANVARLEDVLKADPNFSFKLLGMANSAFYGSMNKISNLHSAITLLGFNTIKNLAVQASINQCFNQVAANPYFSFETMWKHSIGVAVCTKMLARRLKQGNAEDFFTMGILHDIGLLIESQFYTQELVAVLASMAETKKALPDMEMETFGFMHPQVTHVLCEKWALPTNLTQTLKFHHAPGSAPEEHRRSASVVYLADKIVMKAGYGFAYERGDEQEAEVLALFKLEPVDVEVISEDFQAEADQFASALQGG